VAQRPLSGLTKFRRKRHPARAAARAAHGDEDALLLLVAEIGALQHGAGLLLEQVVQGQVAGHDAVVVGRDGRGRRRGGLARRFLFPGLRHHGSVTPAPGDPHLVALCATVLPRSRERNSYFATFFI
jgi:hypothetical protein